jgi:flagellar basal body P-ring formation protein FlgA
MDRLSRYICLFFSIWIFLSVMLSFPDIADSSTKILAEDVKNAVSDHVGKNHPWASGSVRIQILTRLSDIILPQESVTFEVVYDPNEDFIGDANYVIKYYSGRKLVKEETVRVGIEVLTDVVVSKRELVKNREITGEDVCVQKKWLKRIPANVVTVLSDIVGKTLAFNVRPNSEITKNSIRTPLLIKRGNIVRIVFDNNLFSIATVGISEEDGARDKVIKVKNLSSNKIIYARVTGDSLVKVEF